MLERVLLATAVVPDTTTELRLYQSGDLFSIKIMGRGDLMSSRMHGSERALAELACAHIGNAARPRLLVGGLGMGFTLRAALDAVSAEAEVVVSELVPAVVDWNRDLIGAPAGHPLRDKRTSVHIGDVARLIQTSRDRFDAIMLDVDNGPEGLVRRQNDWLYSLEGLAAARVALRPGGVLVVWSAGPDRSFTQRLRKAGYHVDEKFVHAHRKGKGSRHLIWVAT
jgi:spermidine synthase